MDLVSVLSPLAAPRSLTYYSRGPSSSGLRGHGASVRGGGDGLQRCIYTIGISINIGMAPRGGQRYIVPHRGDAPGRPPSPRRQSARGSGGPAARDGTSPAISPGPVARAFRQSSHPPAIGVTPWRGQRGHFVKVSVRGVIARPLLCPYGWRLGCGGGDACTLGGLRGLECTEKCAPPPPGFLRDRRRVLSVMMLLRPRQGLPLHPKRELVVVRAQRQRLEATESIFGGLYLLARVAPRNQLAYSTWSASLFESMSRSR